jgi:hypothetical protein
LSRVEESAIKSTYRLRIEFERCEKKNEKSGPMFIPTFSYHKEEQPLKPTKIHYLSNPKPSFNPKRGVKRESPKPREEAFVCMFCGRAGHLDEFCFRRKRIGMRRVEYARNSCRDEFIDFRPHSYSHIPPSFYSRASSRMSSRAFSQFSYGPNHHSYGFGSRENRFERRRFGYGPRPHRGDRLSRRLGFLARGSYTHFKQRHLDGPRFSHRGSRPTRPSGDVQRTVKTSSALWLSARLLRFISLTPAFSHRYFLVLCM